MNIQFGKLDSAPADVLRSVSVVSTIVIEDHEAAFATEEGSTFSIGAIPLRALLCSGRVGLQYSLPASARQARKRSLTVWVNPQGHDADTVLAYARKSARRFLPVRRREGSFRVAFADLAAA